MSIRGTSLRRRGALHQWELHYGPNMTPMVDVVMVILIFFMAGASVVGPDWFLRAAAGARAAPAPASDPFALPPARFTIDVRMREGVVSASGLGAADADAPTIQAAARALVERTGAENIEVVVRAADDTPYQGVVGIIDACAAAGVQRIGIAPP